MVSMEEMLEHEDAQQYKESLEELTFNSRPHIVNLTELARDYGRKIPQAIVCLIEKKIMKSKKAELPTLYLMDSILKNHAHPYKPMFARILPNVFTYVFAKGDENTRASMFKLRNTWTPLFSRDILFDLDTRVKKIDRAWPIVDPGAAQDFAKKQAEKTGTIHVNPNFIGRQKSTDSSGKDDEISKMEAELKMLKKKKLEMELKKLKDELKESEDSTTPTTSGSSSTSNNTSSTSNTSSSRKETSSSSRKSTSVASQKVCYMVMVS